MQARAACRFGLYRAGAKAAPLPPITRHSRRHAPATAIVNAATANRTSLVMISHDRDAARGDPASFGSRLFNHYVYGVPEALVAHADRAARRLSRKFKARQDWALEVFPHRRSSSAASSGLSSSSASRSSAERLSQRAIASSARSPGRSFRSSETKETTYDKSPHRTRNSATFAADVDQRSVCLAGQLKADARDIVLEPSRRS